MTSKQVFMFEPHETQTKRIKINVHIRKRLFNGDIALFVDRENKLCWLTT